MSTDPQQNSPQPTATTSQGSIAGFPAAAIKLLHQAQKINKVSILCIVVAIFAFVVFGTLASLKMFHGSRQMYWLFHYLPYILVGLTIPFTLYQAFLVYRYRLSQPSMLVTSVGGASLLLIICLLFSLSNWLWLAMAAWIGVAYWFQATFKRFFNFIETRKSMEAETSET